MSAFYTPSARPEDIIHRSHKYKNREWRNGRWRYEYDDLKKSKKNYDKAHDEYVRASKSINSFSDNKVMRQVKGEDPLTTRLLTSPKYNISAPKLTGEERKQGLKMQANEDRLRKKHEIAEHAYETKLSNYRSARLEDAKIKRHIDKGKKLLHKSWSE